MYPLPPPRFAVAAGVAVSPVRSVCSNSSEDEARCDVLCECARCLEESAILGLGGLELDVIGMNGLVYAPGQ